MLHQRPSSYIVALMLITKKENIQTSIETHSLLRNLKLNDKQETVHRERKSIPELL